MSIGTTIRRALFDPGDIVVAPGANKVLSQDDVLDALVRHFGGDWGEVDEHEWTWNDDAVEYGGRILSAYSSGNQTRFWIITAADRSATTILLPEEY